MHINAVDSLSYSGYEKRNQFFNKVQGKDLFVPPKKSEEADKSAKTSDKKIDTENKANLDKLIM